MIHRCFTAVKRFSGARPDVVCICSITAGADCSVACDCWIRFCRLYSNVGFAEKKEIGSSDCCDEMVLKKEFSVLLHYP